MRSAAIRAIGFVVLALAGGSSSAAMAGVQLDPIGTVTSAISTIASQTTVVSGLTGSATSATSGSGATDAVSGATDFVSGSAAPSGSGTTDANSSGADGGSRSTSSRDASSGSATASNPRSPKTRFDRLPRRYETLLERIESGRNVRANIARLRALLASASPQLRARVMRLIRLEIHRLERGGLTRRERAAVQRLGGLLTMLQGQATRGPLSLGRVEGSGILSATASRGGVEAATAGSESPLAGRSPMSARDGASNAIPRLPLALPPPPPGSLFYWPLLILGAVAFVFVRLLRALRQSLPSAVHGTVEVDQPDNWAATAAIGVGLLTCLVVLIALIQGLR
jgi:hypothetical protein